MPLTTVEQLRSYFPFAIHSDIQDDQLRYSLASAANRLSSWLPAGVYAATESEAETETRRMILANAEGHLAMHFAIVGLNTQLRAFGLVKTEAVEGNTVNSYFSPTETAAVQTQFLELAREIAEPYLASDGTPSAPFALVEEDA